MEWVCLNRYVRILVPTNSFFSFNIRKRRVGYDQQFGFQKVCDIYQVFFKFNGLFMSQLYLKSTFWPKVVDLKKKFKKFGFHKNLT